MPDRNAVILLLSVHELLCATLLYFAQRKKHYFILTHLLWVLLIPVFGPIAGYSLLRAHDREPPDADWLAHQEEKHRMNIVSRSYVDLTVPLEEALLINDPHKRRSIMMNILRSDPMRYLDLLLIARYNDDAETAHYATASIMELQRHFQLELQELQQKIARDSADMAYWRKYIELLSRYCDSGLLEGQLLRRQQLLLENALDAALGIQMDGAFLRIRISNCLALKKAEEAKDAAQTLMRLLPEDENSWLEGMRVYAETHDQGGMRALLERIKTERIDFSAAGREHLLYFSGSIK